MKRLKIGRFINVIINFLVFTEAIETEKARATTASTRNERQNKLVGQAKSRRLSCFKCPELPFLRFSSKKFNFCGRERHGRDKRVCSTL